MAVEGRSSGCVLTMALQTLQVLMFLWLQAARYWQGFDEDFGFDDYIKSREAEGADDIAGDDAPGSGGADFEEAVECKDAVSYSHRMFNVLQCSCWYVQYTPFGAT